MPAQDLTAELQDQVADAYARRAPLQIVAGNSKAFYGGAINPTAHFSVSGHQGIIDYEPSELIITLRAGTPLLQLEAVLAAQGQMLGFEPPYFTPQATIGGVLACGFSGPRRPFAGSARDFMLGCRILNGRAELLRFGGQVIKNVAGFDVSRLMVGALGQLGVLLEVTVRVLPQPEAELTLCFEVTDPHTALQHMQRWQGQPWPISGLSFTDNKLYCRLSGAEAATYKAAKTLGGEHVPQGNDFWCALREQTLPFFQQKIPLWRISLPPATPMLDLPGNWLIDWGGAQRWLLSAAPAPDIHAQALAHAGHAICFRGGHKNDWLRLTPEVLTLQQRVKQAFDPLHLLNPSRLIPDP